MHHGIETALPKVLNSISVNSDSGKTSILAFLESVQPLLLWTIKYFLTGWEVGGIISQSPQLGQILLCRQWFGCFLMVIINLGSCDSAKQPVHTPSESNPEHYRCTGEFWHQTTMDHSPLLRAKLPSVKQEKDKSHCLETRRME